MGNRNLVFIAVTVVAVVAAVAISQQRAPQTSKETPLLFPNLAAKVNEVSELQVRDALSELTVRRVSGTWRVAEGDDYPALVDKVKQTVVGAADLRIVAEKTQNPDLHKRLGVEDLESKGAESHLLTLKSDGEALASFIKGKTRRSQSPSHSPGFYARLPGQPQALLVEGGLEISTDVAEWIERDIVDIEGVEVSDIRISHREGPEVILKRETPEDDLVVQNIPEGKEQESEYAIVRLAGLMANIYVNGVKRADRFASAAPAASIEVKTFDGLLAMAQVYVEDENTYAQFSFAAAPEAAEKGAEAEVAEAGDSGAEAGDDGAEADDDGAEAGETEGVGESAASSEVAGAGDAGAKAGDDDAGAGDDGAEAGDDDAGSGDDGAEDAMTPAERAKALNALTAGWAYQLSDSKAELFTKPQSELVRDPVE